MIQSYWTPVLALLAALTYVMAVMALKRAATQGAGLWHSTFFSNVAAGLLFQGLLVFPGHWPPLSQFWQPAVVALLFLAGQILTLYSLQNGDVSIATPVLGLKIVLVTGFTTLVLAQPVGWHMWLAAAMATAGVALLNHNKARKAGTRVLGTVMTAAGAAACYALFDVLVQKFSPQWGLGRFLPVAIGLTGLLSIGVVPFFPSSPLRLPPHTQKWLCLGALLFGLQSLVFVSSIAYFGAAAGSNVVYSSRGLLSILAVAFIGHLFHLEEGQMGKEILRWRFGGAICMFWAIVLVLL